MRVLLAGSSGFLGKALRAELVRNGHEVRRLVRRPTTAADESPWDPQRGEVDQAAVDRADLVVNVAGTPLYALFTAGQRREFRSARIDTTRTLAEAIARAPEPPALLAQSASGGYGYDRGDEILTESTPDQGPDRFMQQVVHDWEAAGGAAEEAGARVCRMRTTPVLDRSGGVLQVMLPVFRLGLGARLGSGRQYFSMVSLRDWVAAAVFLAEHDSASGTFNVAAPEPPTNAEFTAALGRALHRPAKLVVPSALLTPVLRDLAGEALGSLRVVPERLPELGFEFRDRSVDQVIAAALTRAA